uniref:Alcohol dehydrogenase, zinc-binding domain protein n=1 Tax=Solibacter usitatus (strain Ellin6076) TaxID=234267 RepID=Q01YN8_SOLUE
MLVEGRAPMPVPGEGELLIRVLAAGITTTELGWYPTTHTKSGETRKGAVPTHEFSGVIADGPEKGHPVFGMNDWYAEGALAEYCTAPVASVAAKPQRLTHEEAASVPIGALTAWQGLYDRAKLRAGERVLVHGGSGAVGVFAIQLARLRGAHVIATASARHLDFVRALGAEESVDYRGTPYKDKVDVVFDTVGGETLARSWSLLGEGGRMVTIVSGAEDSAEAREREAFFIVEPNRKQLTEVAELLQGGQLTPVVDTVIPLSWAAEAYTGQLTRSGRGRVVVAIEKSER